ncbi:MAG: ATP-binding protein [Methanoregula sp.]|jgi:K+-sensing histidine kinase KdpD|uniref:ATP-binding protein n=1 Tax=Methanoregula sp. TaxID=2052170 RepID=UPI003D108E5D
MVFSLYDNPIRHGEQVTGIYVTGLFSNDGCPIVPEDDGIGVPAQDNECIFERDAGKQTGPGLFLVQEIPAITGITVVRPVNPEKAHGSGAWCRKVQAGPEGSPEPCPDEGNGRKTYCLLHLHR